MPELVEREPEKEMSTTIYQVASTDPDGQADLELYVTYAASPGPMVIFTNGSGISGFDETNRFVAAKLNSHGLSTCQIKILTPPAEKSPGNQNGNGFSSHMQFEAIGTALISAAMSLKEHYPALEGKICIFASGDGTAAALFAAAVNPAAFAALVISGGRLASVLTYAARNTVPTLFISGSEDNISSAAAQAAYSAIRVAKAKVLINGAGHRLREPGALEEVAGESLTWFQKYT